MAGNSQLAKLARSSLHLAPLLLGVLFAEFYRWLRRRWARRPLAAKLGHKLREPFGRPGLDDDHRYQMLEDDPRYFPGAVLGKAQRAAKGMKFHPGTNTASFDPASTLVEPALRCICGLEGAVFQGTIRPDDLIVCPDFFGCVTDERMYEKLRVELQDITAEKHSFDQASVCQQVKSRVQEYFRLDLENCGCCLTWHEQPGAPALTVKSPNFDAMQSSGRYESVVHAVFGGTCEFRLQRPGNKEYVAIPCRNGALQLVSSGSLTRWECQRATLETWSHGLISWIILGSPWGMSRRKLAAMMPHPVPVDIQLGDPLHRPAMRIRVTRQDARKLSPISHDDVIVIPEFFGGTDDWDAYYLLLREIREGQAGGVDQTPWESWHEGSHLLTKTPTCSRTFNSVLDKICEQFSIANGHRREHMGRDALGMRFNWYRDGSDWKPFHHDSAAFNPRMAAKQNCTVGVSLGAMRELAFRSVESSDLIYFPQSNAMLFFFGRDVNIRWQHGLNALPLEQQSGKGRISLILWGLCQLAIEEIASPPMLQNFANGKGNGKGKDARAEVCRNFQRGNCVYGQKCRYSHGSG